MLFFNEMLSKGQKVTIFSKSFRILNLFDMENNIGSDLDHSYISCNISVGLKCTTGTMAFGGQSEVQWSMNAAKYLQR